MTLFEVTVAEHHHDVSVVAPLQAIVANSLNINPDTYRFVSVGPITAGFVFNVLVVCMVITELWHTALAHNQRLGFHVREVLWGGVNPLPHYADLCSGSLSEIDYEVCACVGGVVAVHSFTYCIVARIITSICRVSFGQLTK